MKITKHPNPTGNGTIGLTDNRRRSIAFVWDFEDADSTANLFAAAPDLLAALEECRQWIGYVPDGDGEFYDELRRVTAMMDAAIAAAKGVK